MRKMFIDEHPSMTWLPAGEYCVFALKLITNYDILLSERR